MKIEFLLLGVASLLGLAMALTRRDAGYLAVLVWAFAGIAVKQTSAPTVVLSAWSAAALMLGLALFSLVRRRAGCHRGGTRRTAPRARRRAPTYAVRARPGSPCSLPSFALDEFDDVGQRRARQFELPTRLEADRGRMAGDRHRTFDRGMKRRRIRFA